MDLLSLRRHARTLKDRDPSFEERHAIAGELIGAAQEIESLRRAQHALQTYRAEVEELRAAAEEAIHAGEVTLRLAMAAEALGRGPCSTT